MWRAAMWIFPRSLSKAADERVHVNVYLNLAQCKLEGSVVQSVAALSD